MAIADELIALLGYEIEGEELVKRYEKSLDRVNKRLTKFAETAGKVAGVATTALVSGFGLLGRSVVQTSAQFETYQATLETIEGSADKARQSLDWIADFGKTTPYDVAQVTEAFVALKAYGIDPIADDALRTLGDTASAMGKPLQQAVEAFADAATGEFERLKEFGIKAKSQGDNVTFAWTKNGKEMTKTVKKSSNEIRAFLLETMGDRFSGAMDRQSKTWVGMMSNLGDTWTDFQRRIGEAGFFDDVKANLTRLLDALAVLDENGTLDRWAENLSDTLSKALYFFEIITERFVTNIKFLIDNWDSLKTPMMIIGALFGFVVARAFPLITIFSLIALATDDLLSYLQGGESIIGDFIEWIQELTGVSETVAQALAGLGGVVGSAFALAFLFAPFKVMKLFYKGIKGTLTKLGPMIFKILKSLGPMIVGRFAAMRMAMLAAVALWGPAVAAKFAALGAVIMKGAAAAFALLSNPIGWGILLAGAAGLVYYFWDDLKEGWNWLSGKVGELATMFGDWFANASWAEILVAVVAPIPTLFFNALNAIFPGIKENIVGMFQGIIDWVLEIDWSALGTGMMNAIWDGMKTIGEQIKAWFLTLVPDWAKDFIGVGDEGPGAQPNPNAGKITPSNQPQVDKALPSGQSGSVALTSDALDYKLELQRQEWQRMQGNLEANMAKMVGSEPIDATITDARQDNRQFPFESNVTVNQNVTQATDAPGAAARATGDAVSGTVAKQRSQVEAEPSTQ